MAYQDWTVSIYPNDSNHYTVVYENPLLKLSFKQAERMVFGETLESLKSRLRQQVESFETEEVKTAGIQFGVPLDLTPAETPKSDFEKAKAAYYALKFKYQNRKSLVGVEIKADDAELLQLEVDVKAAYRSEYYA